MGFTPLTIVKEIESIKQSLNVAAAQNGYDLADHHILLLSQKLDALILEYYRIHGRKR